MAYVTITRQLITAKVTALDATPDCGRLALARGKENGTIVEVWDSAGNTPIHDFHVPFVVLDFVKLGRDGRHIAYGAGGGVKYRDMVDGEDVELDPQAKAEIFGRGAMQAVRDGNDEIVLRWGFTGERLARWPGAPSGEIVTFTPHPVHLLLKRDTKNLVVWDLSQLRETFSIPVCLSYLKEPVHAAASSRLNWLAVDDGGLTVYDLQSGGIRWRRMPGDLPANKLSAMQATADGRYLVTATLDAVIRVWRIADGARMAAFPCDSRISRLIVRGKRLVAGTFMGTLYILELQDLAMGPPLLQVWSDGMGGWFGDCPRCGWQGDWNAASVPGRSRCPSCHAEFDV